MVDNQYDRHPELGHVNTEDLLLSMQMNSQDQLQCIDNLDGILNGSQKFSASQSDCPTMSQIIADVDFSSGVPVVMDNVEKCPQEPEHWDHFPMLINNQGTVNFDVCIPQQQNKSTYAYSNILDKMFIKHNTMLRLEVSYNYGVYGKMFLRTMIVYPDSPYEPVLRCNNHKVPSQGNVETSGQEVHVIKCPHDNVIYVGTEYGQKFKDRLALIFPLASPQIVKNENTEKLQASVDMLFICANSCPTGINRRATNLFLTLEDEHGFMYGQKSIKLKVCTVPKRDKVHEEQTKDKKRKSSGPSAPPPNGKKVRIVQESADCVVKSEQDSEENGNQVQCERVTSAETMTSSIACKIIMPDVESMKNVLHFAHNEIAGKIVNEPENPHYGKFMKNIKKQQQSLPSSNEHNSN